MGRKKSKPIDRAREAVEEIRPHVGPILDALTGPDPKGREAAAGAVLERSPPPLVGAIVDLAVERLVCVEDADLADVVDGLCQIGQSAVAHLVYHLGWSKGERARVRLVEALSAIGRALPPPEVVQLMMTVTIHAERDPSERVRSAGAQAILVLRQAIAPKASGDGSEW